MKATNKAITYIKAIAIFSVICAHCNSVGDASPLVAVISSRTLQVIGTWGVGCFFFLSGALYAPKKNFFEIVKGKAISIGIPWVISATAVYLYVTLRKSSLNILDWVLYVIGYNTYCYYLSVLFVFFIIFYFAFMRKKASCLILIVVWFLSAAFFYHRHILTAYLDVFNWIGYFAFGVLIRQNIGLFESVFKKILKYRVVVYLITTSLTLVSVLTDTSGYLGIKNIFNVLFGCLTVLLAGTRLSFVLKFKAIETVGNNTLFIYLWHMPIAGITAKLLANGVFVYFVALRPLLVLGVMYVALLALTKVLRNVKSNWIYTCLGLSKRS